MGLAFGRDFAIHAAIDAGGIADRILAEAERLSGLRSFSEDGKATRSQAGPVGN